MINFLLSQGGLGTKEQWETFFAHDVNIDFQWQWYMCLGHRVDVVTKLQPVLNPQVRSVTCLVLLVAALLVGAWALAIGHQMFGDSLTSYQ